VAACATASVETGDVPARNLCSSARNVFVS
ncbi:hypothetical protein CSUI_005872, partial [Cystoisospora suis]